MKVSIDLIQFLFIYSSIALKVFEVESQQCCIPKGFYYSPSLLEYIN